MLHLARSARREAQLGATCPGESCPRGMPAAFALPCCPDSSCPSVCSSMCFSDCAHSRLLRQRQEHGR